MSWLTGLAGKAENLLNNLDQAAGQALHDDDLKPWKGKTQNENSSDYSPYLSQDAAQKMSSSSSVPNKLNEMNAEKSYLNQMSRSMYSASSASENSSGKTTPPTSGKYANARPTASAKKTNDDELFAFLNTPETENSQSAKRKPINKAVMNGKHSRQSSTSSTTSNRSSKALEAALQQAASDDTASPAAVQSSKDQPEGGDSSTIEMPEDLLGNDSSSGYHSNQDDGGNQQQISGLELENRLLKNEVSSLNQEMTTVLQRTKAAQEELSSLKRKMDVQHNQLMSTEQIIRELRSRESDLTESLNAKDSQLGVLRIRLEETDKELEAKKNTIENIRLEKQKILEDHTSSSGVQGQALEIVKEKLNDALAQVKREKEAYSKLQQEASSRQSSLESAQHDLAESLSTAQKKLTEERARVSELNMQVKSAKSSAETAKQELTTYKEKATRILQSKEKLISSLKEGNVGSSGADAAIQSAELEELKNERDMLKEELQAAQMSIDNLRAELSELELQAQQDSEESQEQIESLEEQLRGERQRREESDQELASIKQEMKYANEELVKQKTAFQSRLSDRDNDIERLRNQLTTKSNSSTSQVELENRLHALTESLIQKQTMLEALGTEKNSLTLQLERMEKQHREFETLSIRNTATAVHMSEEEDGTTRQRLPGFLRESPADGDMARKVKRAAGSIDKFSIRLGVFLRRYPIARVMVIVYMVLLHVWTLIVLMTYQPEIHGDDYLHEPQPPH